MSVQRDGRAALPRLGREKKHRNETCPTCHSARALRRLSSSSRRAAMSVSLSSATLTTAILVQRVICPTSSGSPPACPPPAAHRSVREARVPRRPVQRRASRPPRPSREPPRGGGGGRTLLTAHTSRCAFITTVISPSRVCSSARPGSTTSSSLAARARAHTHAVSVKNVQPRLVTNPLTRLCVLRIAGARCSAPPRARGSVRFCLKKGKANGQRRVVNRQRDRLPVLDRVLSRGQTSPRLPHRGVSACDTPRWPCARLCLPAQSRRCRPRR